MKKGVKRSIEIVVFAILLTACIWRTYIIFSWKDTSGAYISSTSQLYHTEPDLMDVVFLGSSHCYCGIYPCFLWRDYGIAAFDMATSGQDKDTTYHALIETLKTQSPKVVCVDMYGLLHDEHGVQGNVYRNMLALRSSTNSIGLVQDYIPKKERLDYYLRWPIVHTRYKELGKYDFISYELSTYGRGECPGWVIGTSYKDEEAVNNQEIAPLSEKNQKWLDRLYELSQKEQFNIIFMMIPSSVSVNEQQMLNAVSEYAKQHGIPFLDFNRIDIGLDYTRDFIDDSHLNAFVSAKFTCYLVEYLDGNYQLEDHRGDASYVSWDLDLKHYNQMEGAFALEQSGSIAEYMERLSRMSDVVGVISLEGNFLEAAEDYYETLSMYGVNDSDYQAGGQWLYRDGCLEKIPDTSGGNEFRLDLSETDTLRIRYSDDFTTTNVMIDKTNSSNAYNYLSIVTYDLFRKEIIGQREF